MFLQVFCDQRGKLQNTIQKKGKNKTIVVHRIRIFSSRRPTNKKLWGSALVPNYLFKSQRYQRTLLDPTQEPCKPWEPTYEPCYSMESQASLRTRPYFGYFRPVVNTRPTFELAGVNGKKTCLYVNLLYSEEAFLKWSIALFGWLWVWKECRYTMCTAHIVCGLATSNLQPHLYNTGMLHESLIKKRKAALNYLTTHHLT